MWMKSVSNPVHGATVKIKICLCADRHSPDSDDRWSLFDPHTGHWSILLIDPCCHTLLILLDHLCWSGFSWVYSGAQIPVKESKEEMKSGSVILKCDPRTRSHAFQYGKNEHPVINQHKNNLLFIHTVHEYMCIFYSLHKDTRSLINPNIKATLILMYFVTDDDINLCFPGFQWQ